MHTNIHNRPNFRSQNAVAKFGAGKAAEERVAYQDDVPQLNFTYRLRRDTARARQ